jgi:hypothetical protein
MSGAPAGAAGAAAAAPVDPRDAAIAQFRRKFLEHRELETSLKKSQTRNAILLVL